MATGWGLIGASAVSIYVGYQLAKRGKGTAAKLAWGIAGMLFTLGAMGLRAS